MKKLFFLPKLRSYAQIYSDVVNWYVSAVLPTPDPPSIATLYAGTFFFVSVFSLCSKSANSACDALL